MAGGLQDFEQTIAHAHRIAILDGGVWEFGPGASTQINASAGSFGELKMPGYEVCV